MGNGVVGSKEKVLLSHASKNCVTAIFVNEIIYSFLQMALDGCSVIFLVLYNVKSNIECF